MQKITCISTVLFVMCAVNHAAAFDLFHKSGYKDLCVEGCCKEKGCCDDYRPKCPPKMPCQKCGVCPDYCPKCPPKMPCMKCGVCPDYCPKPTPHVKCPPCSPFYKCPPKQACCSGR